MSVVYVSIGNSDDKLPQSVWAEFQVSLYDAVRKRAEQVHGVWYSDSTSEFQNACVCAEVPDGLIWMLREDLEGLAADYWQDSIALAIAETEFVRPQLAAKLPTAGEPPEKESNETSGADRHAG